MRVKNMSPYTCVPTSRLRHARACAYTYCSSTITDVLLCVQMVRDPNTEGFPTHFQSFQVSLHKSVGDDGGVPTDNEDIDHSVRYCATIETERFRSDNFGVFVLFCTERS